MQPGAETILEETRHQQVFCLRATREKCGFHIPAGDGRLALPVTHTLPSLRTYLKSHGSHVSQAHPQDFNLVTSARLHPQGGHLWGHKDVDRNVGYTIQSRIYADLYVCTRSHLHHG